MAQQWGKRIMRTLGMALLCALMSPAAHAVFPEFNLSVRDASHPDNFQEQRERRQDEQRRYNSRREDAQDTQRAQRLSPEERQQLRRDIKNAGRELYRSRP